MEYELTRQEIDIISLALKNRIDYLEGLWLLQENNLTEESKQRLSYHIRITKDVQRKTTYFMQDKELQVK